MKLYDASVVVLIILAVTAVVGYTSQFYLGDDNAVEETAEEVIKSKTGVDIDLSPDSPETN